MYISEPTILFLPCFIYQSLNPFCKNANLTFLESYLRRSIDTFSIISRLIYMCFFFGSRGHKFNFVDFLPLELHKWLCWNI